MSRPFRWLTILALASFLYYLISGFFRLAGVKWLPSPLWLPLGLVGMYACVVINAFRKGEFHGQIGLSPPARGLRDSLAVAGVMGIVFLLAMSYFYRLMFSGWFVGDDFVYLKDAVCIRQSPWSTLVEPVRLADYRPLATLFCLLNHRLWGFSFFGFSISNLAVHFMNCLVLFLLGSRVVASRLKAGIACILFAIHPIATVTVPLVISGETNIATLLSLASVLAYMVSMERRRSIYYVIANLLFAVAVLTKESAYTLPLVIFFTQFIYDAERKIPLGSAFKKSLLCSLPFACVLAALIVWRFYLLGGTMGNDMINPRPSPDEAYSLRGVAFRFFYNIPASYCVSDGTGMMRLGAHPWLPFLVLTAGWCALVVLSFRGHLARLHCQTLLCLMLTAVQLLPVSALIYGWIIMARWLFPALPYFCLLLASLYDECEGSHRRGAVALLLAMVACFFFFTSNQIAAKRVAFHEKAQDRNIQEGIVSVVKRDFPHAPPGSVFLIMGLNDAEKQGVTNWAIKTLSQEPRFWEYLFLYSARKVAGEWFVNDSYPECLLDQIWLCPYPAEWEKQEYPDFDLFGDGECVGYLTWTPLAENSINMKGKIAWVDCPSSRTGGRWVELNFPAPTIDEALGKKWDIHFFEYARDEGFKPLRREEVVARRKRAFAFF
jgi:hypothetical protein